MKPTATLSVTDRYKLKELQLERSGAVTPGRVMWCKGRKVLGYGDVTAINAMTIPKGATHLAVSAVDYDDVKGWLA